MFKSLKNIWTTVAGIIAVISGALSQYSEMPADIQGWLAFIFVIATGLTGILAKDGRTGSSPGATK
jgi:uncharacterized membrane protein